MPISHIAFLTPGNFADDAPGQGLQECLRLFAHAEALGFHGGWVRQRHLEPGISSAAVFLAAAGQRTRRLELGAAVIQMGYENPLRLAEDLAMADLLSGGRLQVGLSAGPPSLGAMLGSRFLDAAMEGVDYSHARVTRLRENLQGALIGDAQTTISSAAGELRPRVRPHAPGLAQRLWYGAGSLRSAEWAGREGLNLLVGNITAAGSSDDFFDAQFEQVLRHGLHVPAGTAPRVALGRVIVPTDSADTATRRRYRDYAASRQARTLMPHGERRTLFAPDLVGSTEEILEALARDRVLPLVSELRLELPYNFAFEDYAQILSDFRARIAPELARWPAAAQVLAA